MLHDLKCLLKNRILWTLSPNTNSAHPVCLARSLSDRLHLESIDSVPARSPQSGWLGNRTGGEQVTCGRSSGRQFHQLLRAVNSQSVEARYNLVADKSAITSASSAQNGVAAYVKISVRRWKRLNFSLHRWSFHILVWKQKWWSCELLTCNYDVFSDENNCVEEWRSLIVWCKPFI